MTELTGDVGLHRASVLPILSGDLVFMESEARGRRNNREQAIAVCVCAMRVVGYLHQQSAERGGCETVFVDLSAT